LSICARCKEERPIVYLVRSDIIADFVCAECGTAARGLEPAIQVERVLIDDFQLACLRLLSNWFEWRTSHDVKAAKLNCCERSTSLFDALADFERAINDRGGLR